MEKRNIKNLRIIRILLSNPEGTLTKYRIAKSAECSVPWVIEFLRKLEEKKLVKKTKVLDTDGLIDYYIQAMPKIKHFDFYAQEPVNLLKKIKLQYALTTYIAENYVSHHLFPSRYDIYIKEEDVERWKEAILKNGMLGKGNFRLMLAYDEKIFAESASMKGINVVSLPTLMIDLKKEGGVCVEAYQLLRKTNV